MSTQGQTEARAVDWSFPMNPSQLPPKSPGSFQSFGAGPLDSSTAGRTSLTNRVGNHKRTPSAGYLPQTQPTWMDGVVDAPEAPSKRGTHRRSASESMAFLDGTNFSKMVDDNINEEDDYESRSVASMHSGGHSGGGSVDFDRLDEDQLMSMFGNDSDPIQKQQQQESNRKNNSDATRASSANNAGASDNWASERGRTPGTKQNDPSTPSDSNSVSEVSNEDPKGGLGKYKSEPDVQSSGDHEGGTQTFSKGELQQALAGLDSSLDPKRAKRILANRQSAQRSRVRKLQYISELERSVTALQSEVSTMAPQVAFFEHRRAVLNVDNNAIKQKMAALVQGQRFKDAHNEALQKEVQRLRQLYQQQQHQMQQPQHLQSGAPTSAYDLQHQQGESTLGAVPDIFASGLSMGADSMSTGSLSPTHSRTRSLPHSLNTMVASTW
ncbi:hypothetical protein M758_3G180400 [Ceratodon purpureus]|uniref:BZIP domain-containing protein n=1 Tax=Ceratodon purpureus TaxID=3225 RepID=A0A8T0IM40_CERPU|nr:hypothetical protein KC19_3G179600 [Ceratodon purpureus]KAG0623522.1 hypothetical protein M758_3G180400 [Ceratodon purpureus]